MHRFGPIGRLLGVTAAVSAVALAVSGAPAHAAGYNTLTTYMTSANNSQLRLGYGTWYSNPVGSTGNGYVEAHDSYCDGLNGIFAMVTGAGGSTWSTSAQGCGLSNYKDIPAAAQGGPAYGERITLTVCKLLPDGNFKSCSTRAAVNRPV
ncbi:hypothetical protein [Dactylosporangium sp. NPDC005555]|uniref:hypothetical protein n=1 Tax=Dactylosporangium sp. NPDC005555 TaxID=3154889 RepID=UPI0033A02BC2